MLAPSAKAGLDKVAKALAELPSLKLTVVGTSNLEAEREGYKRADISKPRSMIGLAKDLPVDDMEKLLLASILVNDDTMQALALQRGVAVKEYLASKDLPLERLFLGASNSGEGDVKLDAKPDAKWVPR